MPPKIATDAQFEELRARINGTGPAASGKGNSRSTRNIRTETALGTMADSRHEAREINKLFERQARHQIANLRTQEPFDLCINGTLICRYKADATFLVREEFTIETMDGPTLLTVGTTAVLDAKGHKTEIYRLKKKLMKAILDIDILEIGI